MSAQGATVTVAVVSWNTRDLLGRCLDSLRAAADAGGTSVIVVDNCSSDGSPEMVQSEHPWVELLQPTENLGFGRAVNLAAAKSATPWLVAANADVELIDDALDQLLRAGERIPQAGAVAPRLVLPDGSTQHSVHSFPSPRLAALFGLGVHRLSQRLADRLCIHGYWNPDQGRYVDWAHGAFLLIRRDDFDRIGGFDESQWMYAEDIDLGWRLHKAGRPVYYEPQARVRHAVSAAARKAFADFERDRRHIVASYLWLARRRGRTIARTTGWINLAGAVTRFAIFSPLARVSGTRWKKARDDARRFVALHRAGIRATSTPTLAPEGPGP